MSTPAAPDVKTAVKAMKVALDSASYSRVLEIAGSVPPLLLQSHDPKLQSLIYTYHAFVGLAYYQLREYAAAEKSYSLAIALQPEQFPAYKGQYDVLMAVRPNDTEALKAVLEKLVEFAPPNLKKLGYQVQLARMQIEQQPQTSSTSSSSSSSAAPAVALSPQQIQQLEKTLQSILSDKNLIVPADSKDPTKDALEVTRINLEAHTLLLMIHEAQWSAAKSAELKVRIDRQLTKYRTEKVAADKLKAQQAASKAGQIAAAVKAAKGGPAVLTQAEEEAEIIRKVTLKLEKDWQAEHEAKENEEYTALLVVPSPLKANADTLDPAHQYVMEKLLARLILKSETQGWFAAPTPASAAASPSHASSSASSSSDSFTAGLQAIESRAEELVRKGDKSGKQASAYAWRVLTGIRWCIGGATAIGASATARNAALERQKFFEQATQVLANDPTYSWMAWHALATSMVSTEVASTVLPPSVQAALATETSEPSVWELAEMIIRLVPTSADVAAPVASTAASSSSSSVAPATPAAAASPSTTIPTLPPSTPLLPSHLSLLTLSIALYHRGEQYHKECLSTLSLALNSLKAYKSSFPQDSLRSTRDMNYLELTLADVYITKVLDERIFEMGVKILKRVQKSTEYILTVKEKVDAFDFESHIRSLRGLTQCALVQKPPAYNEAEGYVKELIQLIPENDWIWSTHGELKLQEALSLDQATKAEERKSLLEESVKCLSRAQSLRPESSQHAMRLSRVYLLLNDTQHAIEATQTVEKLVVKELENIPSTSRKAQSLRVTHAEALALHGSILMREKAKGDASATVNAQKLFVSSLKLDPSNELAGEGLCSIILSSEAELTPAELTRKYAAVRVLAHTAVKSNPRCLWAWVRLGRVQYHSSAYANAIVSYQNALRIAPDSRRVWEELAECYKEEGQYVAGYKAILKCVELGNSIDASATPQDRTDRRMNLFQLAQAQINLGLMNDAITTLEGLVNTSGNNAGLKPFIPSIKLLAESYYILTNTHIQNGAYQAALVSLNRSIEVAKLCITALNDPDSVGSSGDRQYVSLYKLLGDAYALFNTLPTDSNPADNANTTSTTNDLPLSETKKLAYLQLSTRAYSKAIHLDPTQSENWYDAAISQIHSAVALHAPALAATPAAKPMPHPLETHYRTRALALVKPAIVLTPENTCYWHLLGLIDTRAEVRQHALIQAVNTEPKDAIGWNSLGCFYLQQYHANAHSTPPAGANEQELLDQRQVLLGLSRHALELSQTLDPSNPSLWMAQGLFNSNIRQSLEAYIQAKACFLRSIELYPNSNPLARFGLAYTAYCTGDTSVANFAVRKFVEQYPHHATAWNLAGLIWEHAARDQLAEEKKSETAGVEHAREAYHAFVKSEQLLLNDTQFAEQRKHDLLRMVRVNRARVGISAGLFSESIALYQGLIQQAAQVAAGGVPSASVLATALTLHVDLAHAYMKANVMNEAINVLGTALAINTQQISSVAPEAAGEQQQHLDSLILSHRSLLLQQASYYTMHGDYEGAKGLLQQSVSLYPEHAHPLNYFHAMTKLYSIALIQTDLGTAQYAVQMMQQVIQGLASQGQSSGETNSYEEVMNNLLVIYYRTQSHLALLQGDQRKAGKFLQKLIHLNPTAMDIWNEYHQFLLQQASSRTSAGTPPSTFLTQLLQTATLPSLDYIHANHVSEKDYATRIEHIAQAFLAVGRNGYVSEGGNGSNRKDEKDSEEKESEGLWKSEAEGEDDDETEYNDEADEDVRAKGKQLAPIANVDESWPRQSNLNSSRLSSQLLHMDPTNSQHWCIQASSAYAQALQASAGSNESVSRISALFTKAIKLLQLSSSLLTAELTPSARASATEYNTKSRPFTLGLYETQVALVDCYLHRNDAAASDVQQAAHILASIVEQQKLQGAAFPLEANLIYVFHARLSLRTGDIPQALKYYRAAIEVKPLALEIWEELAEVYSQQGSVQASEACLQAATTLLKAEPLTPAISSLLHRVYVRLSHHYWKLKQHDRGIEYAQFARDASSSTSAIAFFLLGLNHKAAHPDQAMRFFQQSLNHLLPAPDAQFDAPLLTAASSTASLDTLRFNLALLFIRSTGASAAASDAKVSNALKEAREFLLEELTTNGVTHAAVYYQLASTSFKLNDIPSAGTYIRLAVSSGAASSTYYKALQSQIEQFEANSTTGTSSSVKSAAVAQSSEAPSNWDDE